MSAIALQQIEAEGGELISRAAGRQPAKVIARRTGLTERHVRGLRAGEHAPGWAAFIALAQQAPELRAVVARWLGLAPGPEATEARRLIEAALAALPQAGDVANE